MKANEEGKIELISSHNNLRAPNDSPRWMDATLRVEREGTSPRGFNLKTKFARRELRLPSVVKKLSRN